MLKLAVQQNLDKMLGIHSWTQLQPNFKIAAITSDLNHNFEQTTY